MGGKKKGVPEDEYEALRERLLTALRRNPGDTRSLTRLAGSLARMEVMLKRMSPRKREELAENLGAILERFGDLIAPPD